MHADPKAPNRATGTDPVTQVQRELAQLTDFSDAASRQRVKELARPIRREFVFLSPLQQTLETERAKRRL